MEKRCYACQEVKPLGEFPINRTRADGRGSMCKACKSIYNGTYYLATKDRHNPARAASRRRAQAVARQQLSNYLRTHPCVDCGEADIIVLQFDHQGDKKMNVADLVGVATAGHAYWKRSQNAKSYAQMIIYGVRPEVMVGTRPSSHKRR